MRNSADTFLEQGVNMPLPATVFIDPAIPASQIASGVTIHPGCRIVGEKTSIGPGCELGREAPVTLENCQLGFNVKLSGGFFDQAVLLDGVKINSGTHARPVVLLEEQAVVAHCAGLKQTVLLPFVTLGSLINFCDCLMAGGTSPKNHSEVGSSYIHFNYTPHQDKATPSLLGNVPNGVWLDQPPVFLGGQSGLVGPSRVAFGAIIPAGTILREDVEAPGLYQPSPSALKPRSCYLSGRYQSIRRILANNLNYIGNLIALRVWYTNVRIIFMQTNPFRQACHAGAIKALDALIEERLQRLDQLAGKMPQSLKLHNCPSETNEALCRQQNFYDCWPLKRKILSDMAQRSYCLPPSAIEYFASLAQKDYISAVQAAPENIKQIVTSKLLELVSSVTAVFPGQ